MSDDILDHSPGPDWKKVFIILLALVLLGWAGLLWYKNKNPTRGDKLKTGEIPVLGPEQEIKVAPANNGQSPNNMPTEVYNLLRKAPPNSNNKNSTSPSDSPSDRLHRQVGNNSASSNKKTTDDKIIINNIEQQLQKDKTNKDKTNKDKTNKDKTNNQQLATSQTKTAVGQYRLQLGAYFSEADAKSAYQRLKPKLEKATGQKLKTGISSVTTGGKKLYRLNLVGYPTKLAADKTCQKIKQAGLDCLVAKQ